MKPLIDRAGFESRTNGDLLKNKLGAAVAAMRRAGALLTLDTINHFFFGGSISSFSATRGALNEWVFYAFEPVKKQ